MKSPREALQPEAAPPPPTSAPKRKRASLVSIVSGVLSFIIVATVVVGIGWSFAVKRMVAPGPLVADKTVNIAKGDDVPETLEEQGVIDNAQLMKAALVAEGSKDRVKWGEYLFRQNASLQDVIDTLVSGKQVLHALTIPEGLTSLQVVDRMRDNDVLLGNIANIPPEGSLMPDTYKFSRGTTREQLIKTMQQEAKRVVTDVWSHRETDTAVHSPYEMVTLASIVEKETGKADERPRVAGVFMNRLTRNIPLQSDPTIVYGLVGGKGTLGRGILKSEVEQKTPYNTYSIVGLPPGPIANPGKAALEAVANPSKTKDLFFVADGTGGHVFAETLDQHRANVGRWRQLEKDAKDKLVPDAEKTPGVGTPTSTTPSKSNQRGDVEIDPQVFGMIGSFQPVADKPASTIRPERRLDVFPLALPVATTVDDTKLSGTQTAKKGVFDQAFDELDVEVGGVRSKDVPSEEPVVDDGGPPVSLATFPVAPARQAEMRARAATYGLPAAVEPAAPSVTNAAPTQTASATETSAPGAPHLVKIFDASEGTKLDPLLDKTYDLNSAKSVPAIRALPPLTASVSK